MKMQTSLLFVLVAAVFFGNVTPSTADVTIDDAIRVVARYLKSVKSECLTVKDEIDTVEVCEQADGLLKISRNTPIPGAGPKGECWIAFIYTPATDYLDWDADCPQGTPVAIIVSEMKTKSMGHYRFGLRQVYDHILSQRPI